MLYRNYLIRLPDVFHTDRLPASYPYVPQTSESRFLVAGFISRVQLNAMAEPSSRLKQPLTPAPILPLPIHNHNILKNLSIRPSPTLFVPFQTMAPLHTSTPPLSDPPLQHHHSLSLSYPPPNPITTTIQPSYLPNPQGQIHQTNKPTTLYPRYTNHRKHNLYVLLPFSSLLLR